MSASRHAIGKFSYWIEIKRGKSVFYMGAYASPDLAKQSYRTMPRDYELKTVRKKRGTMWLNGKWVTMKEWDNR